jgi:hypothetical protein
MATMTEAALRWLGARASYLSPPGLLAEALLLRGFHARVESERLRVILDHPADRAALAPFLALAADGRVLRPAAPPALAAADASGPGDGLDPRDPWHAAARSVVALGDARSPMATTTEESWRQFRGRGRSSPPPVEGGGQSLDLGVALLVRALCLLDCKAVQSCAGHGPGEGRDVVSDAVIEFASPWDAILGSTLVDMGAGGSPREWRWTWRTLTVPHGAGRDAGALARSLGELQRVAQALLEHPRFGLLRRARVRALAEHGSAAPNAEAFRAALRRRMTPE